MADFQKKFRNRDKKKKERITQTEFVPRYDSFCAVSEHCCMSGDWTERAERRHWSRRTERFMELEVDLIFVGF